MAIRFRRPQQPMPTQTVRTPMAASKQQYGTVAGYSGGTGDTRTREERSRDEMSPDAYSGLLSQAKTAEV